MISIDNLHKSFGGRELFDGVSFKINSKERVGLVGRNGHGKSTLFRIIVGEEGTTTAPSPCPRGIASATCSSTSSSPKTRCWPKA
jgi:ATP-binding cassette subfamily F protein 3